MRGRPQRATRPRQRVPELRELQWSYGGSSRDWRLSCTSGEKTGDECGLGAGAGEDLLRHRSTLAKESWEPKRNVEPRVAAYRQVPVDEQGRSISPEADVVAPDVQVQKLVPVQRARVGGCDKHRKGGGQPVRRYDSCREQGTWIVSDEAPSALQESRASGAWQPGRRLSSGDATKHFQHGRHPRVAPWGWPECGAEVLENKERLFRVVPAKHPGHVRRLQRCIHPMLVPQPTSGQLIACLLEED